MNHSVVMNEQIAEILGAFIGDGWIEKRQTALYIIGSETEDKDYYDKYLGPLFSKFICDVSPRSFPYWNVYGIGCYKGAVIQRCILQGFQIGRKALCARI